MITTWDTFLGDNYADDLCLMASCVIALQELIGLCPEYSVDIDLNFNATKSYCVAFTPKLYKLASPSLYINYLPISYTDSIKYFGYIYLLVTTVMMQKC